MAASNDVAPIIIKRKKIIGGDGHHGGAWKVAYADFVTAMMAFFMLMWLLNATTEKQRKGIADYFAPTIAISRVSGGGDGAFGGESVFSDNTLPQNGTGATAQSQTKAAKARGIVGEDGRSDAIQDEFRELEKALMGRGGESMVAENALRHIITRVTDEGLVIELFDIDGRPLFEPNTAKPTETLRSLASVITNVTQVVTNTIAVEGHVASEPIVIAQSAVWDLSAKRADSLRMALDNAGMEPKRVHRVTGHADREPIATNRMSIRNNRMEVILLRDQQK